MKILFTFFSLWLCSAAMAKDTLTIRQVYDFEVGDTFSYIYDNKIIFNQYDIGYQHECGSYFIKAKYYSSNSDTLYYTQCNYVDTTNCFPRFFTKLDSGIITLDTVVGSNDSLIGYQLRVVDSLRNESYYRTRNTRFSYSRTYVRGYGCTSSSGSFGNNFDYGQSYSSYTYKLTKNHISGGTACVQHVGLSDIKDLHLITISPNPSHDYVEIKLSQYPTSNNMFSLINMVGEVVLKIPVSSSSLRVDLSGINSGIYHWIYEHDGVISDSGRLSVVK